MWKKRKILLAPSSSSKRKKTKDPTSDDISAQIENIQAQIDKEKIKLEKVREDMLTGIVSCESMENKQKIDGLFNTLQTLRDKLESLNLDRTEKEIPDTIPQSAKVSLQKFSFSFQDLATREWVYKSNGYQPIIHLADIMSQFQGKKRSSAPPAIVELIKERCKKYRIELCKVTPRVCRDILKELYQEQCSFQKYNKNRMSLFEGILPPSKKFTDYYKYSTAISYSISNIPPPYITPSQESKIFAIFPLVVDGYKTSQRFLTRKQDKKHRNLRENPNNMNYYFTLYKICQMLGYSEFLQYIPLPKSTSNIDDNDENGWKHCCDLYNWSYTPTI